MKVLKEKYRIIENVNGEEVVRKVGSEETCLKWLMRNCKEPWCGWSTRIDGLYEGINGNGFQAERTFEIL